MRMFETLSESELTALTDAEVNRYVDYACAEQGVALLPDPPTPPVTIDFKPDAVIYNVGYGFHFTDRADAMRVADVINNAKSRVETTYLSTPSGVTSTGVARHAPAPVVPVGDNAFSAITAETLKRDLDGARRAQELYEKLQKEYDAASSARDNVASDIWDKVNEARAAASRRQSMRTKYERYLELADGNVPVATRFLVAAEPEARELLPELFETESV